MKVTQIYMDNALRNYNYLIETKSGDIYCIDPVDAKKILEVLGEKAQKLKAIINTHEHGDHIAGNKEISERLGCEIWAHPNAINRIPHVDRVLSNGEILELSDSEVVEFIHTPGHTMAHVCLLGRVDGKDRFMITGDTLFNAGVGNCHNGGNPEVLFETISKVFSKLEDDVLIYPGHDYLETNLGFTLSREPENTVAKELLELVRAEGQTHSGKVLSMGEERQINCFLRLKSEEIKRNLGQKYNTDKEVFLRLRELRNNW